MKVDTYRGPIMLFYKVLILFWGVLEHALMLGGSKITLFFHIIYIGEVVA